MWNTYNAVDLIFFLRRPNWFLLAFSCLALTMRDTNHKMRWRLLSYLSMRLLIIAAQCAHASICICMERVEWRDWLLNVVLNYCLYTSQQSLCRCDAELTKDKTQTAFSLFRQRTMVRSLVVRQLICPGHSALSRPWTLPCAAVVAPPLPSLWLGNLSVERLCLLHAGASQKFISRPKRRAFTRLSVADECQTSTSTARLAARAVAARDGLTWAGKLTSARLEQPRFTPLHPPASSHLNRYHILSLPPYSVSIAPTHIIATLSGFVWNVIKSLSLSLSFLFLLRRCLPYWLSSVQNLHRNITDKELLSVKVFVLYGNMYATLAYIFN